MLVCIDQVVLINDTTGWCSGDGGGVGVVVMVVVLGWCWGGCGGRGWRSSAFVFEECIEFSVSINTYCIIFSYFPV